MDSSAGGFVESWPGRVIGRIPRLAPLRAKPPVVACRIHWDDESSSRILRFSGSGVAHGDHSMPPLRSLGPDRPVPAGEKGSMQTVFARLSSDRRTGGRPGVSTGFRDVRTDAEFFR